jgi:hypothetical protein
MCIIIDVNIAERIVLRTGDANYKELTECLWGRRRPPVKMVYGGDLLREYRANARLMAALEALDRAGRAVKYPEDSLRRETKSVGRQGLCKSNDQHIIALARVSQTRLLCSRDRDLCDDFKNKSLLDKPRGKIYKNGTHLKLLVEHCR